MDKLLKVLKKLKCVCGRPNYWTTGSALFSPAVIAHCRNCGHEEIIEIE